MASNKSNKKKANSKLINYFQSSFEEIRKVTWPTKNQAIKMTFLVLGFCLVVAIFLGILDFVFGVGYRSLLDLGPKRSLPSQVIEQENDFLGDIDLSGYIPEIDFDTTDEIKDNIDEIIEIDLSNSELNENNVVVENADDDVAENTDVNINENEDNGVSENTDNEANI